MLLKKYWCVLELLAANVTRSNSKVQISFMSPVKTLDGNRTCSQECTPNLPISTPLRLDFVSNLPHRALEITKTFTVYPSPIVDRLEPLSSIVRFGHALPEFMLMMHMRVLTLFLVYRSGGLRLTVHGRNFIKAANARLTLSVVC